jgi:asparagine N-glycosylation enzyme membrane subunit Stt3
VWALFAGCILAMPVLAWQGRYCAAAVLAVLALGASARRLA